MACRPKKSHFATRQKSALFAILQYHITKSCQKEAVTEAGLRLFSDFQMDLYFSSYFLFMFYLLS